MKTKTSNHKPSQEQIAQRAYAIFEQSGRVSGRDLENWLRAESELSVNGKQEAEGKIEHTVPLRFAAYEGMDIGTDNGLPVVPKFIYAKVLPTNFKGTIRKVEFDLGPSKSAGEDLKRMYLERFASAVRN